MFAFIKCDCMFNIYGPQQLKLARRIMMTIVCFAHAAGSISFYQQYPVPTPQQLVMYAMKACVRPVITKICFDPPAWFFVSLISIQLIVASCIPGVQGPLYTAMPDILPSLATLAVSVYLLEFTRRAAFLRSLRVAFRS